MLCTLLPNNNVIIRQVLASWPDLTWRNYFSHMSGYFYAVFSQTGWKLHSQDFPETYWHLVDRLKHCMLKQDWFMTWKKFAACLPSIAALDYYMHMEDGKLKDHPLTSL